MLELCVESLKALNNYWINERDYVRDCRWTQKQAMKINPNNPLFLERYELFDNRYKYCYEQIRNIRKEE